MLSQGQLHSQQNGSLVNILIHDQDTPGNGPLLQTKEAAALGRRRQFADVYGDLGRLDTNRQTVENTADDQHANVLRRTAKNRPNYPNDNKLDHPMGSKIRRETQTIDNSRI